MIEVALEQVGDRILWQEITAPGEGCYCVARVDGYLIVEIEARYPYRTAGERYPACSAARARLKGRPGKRKA